MKTTSERFALAVALGAFPALAASFYIASAAAEPAAPAPAIGVYDSRAIAFAWFWSEPGTRQRNELIAAARAAQKSGDEAAFKAARARVAALQEHNHLQVFSTAPVDEILAELAPGLPALLQQAGVDRLVCQWDEPGLSTCTGCRQVDVTDLLVAALFTPNEKQAKILADLKQKTPLPLDRARELMREGKL